MDSVAIGRFIAAERCERGLTQRQLADALQISDKTVSKWECGNGLPEVSLMLPLCEHLGISVNELLSGERLTGDDYRRKAEENMVNLVKEKEESRRKLILSCIVGGLGIVAALALILLASYLAVPTAVRVVLIAAGVASLAVGIGGAAVLDREVGVFECPHCHARFVPTMRAYTNGIHTLTKRRLTCPECGKTGLCAHRILR